MKKYAFHHDLVVRTPMFPLFGELNRESIQRLLENGLFMEAVYLASPVLYDECIKWKQGNMLQEKEICKLIRSLVKYFTRMSTRCTPFGLFSGNAVVNWGASARVEFREEGFKRHTRFDMHYLCALADHLSLIPTIRQYLHYFPNNSLYRMGDEIRYVEYRHILGKRRYQISAVSSTDFLTAILLQAKKGITLGNIEEMLDEAGAATEDITPYVEDLVSSQVIVSELQPSITGEEYVHKIIAVLKRIYTESENAQTGRILEILTEAVEQLDRIDTARQNNPADYRSIARLLDQLGVAYEENKLFQTDTFKTPVCGTIDAGLQHQIGGALNVLNCLTLPAGDSTLEAFKKRFTARYEEKEMKLLEVLDGETGIGYIEQKNEEHAPFVEDIVITEGKERDSRLRWGAIEKYLLAKLNAAAADKTFTVELTDEEVSKLGTANWDDLPPSVGTMFRLIDDAHCNVMLEYAGGSSAVNVLGRFAHGDEKIHDHIQDIVKKEQAQHEEVIYAEVVHLPESRTGNILLHPAFRQYEIPYLCHSSLPAENQIELSDLFISVKNNTIVLRSRRLNKIVIPRLSNAHNYKANALPVYHFLCDMQTQHKRGALSFNWGSLTWQCKFFPRVKYKNTILSAASWRLDKTDFQVLEQGNISVAGEAVKKFREHWKLPRFLVLAEGDNEMFIDFNNELLLQTFVDVIKKRSFIELKEFIFPSATITDNKTGKVYNNQFAATLIRTCPVEKQLLHKEGQVVAAPQRSFAIGSEWLYFKFYCGIKSADKVLVNAIEPAVQYLLEKKLVSQFFFLRYNDPSFHLRVRFHLTDPRFTGEVITVLHQYVSRFENQGFIWKTQTDTYVRELERYDPSAIELAEEFFHHDSLAALQLFSMYHGDELESLKWTWAILSVDTLLNDFGLSVEQRVSLMEWMKKGYEQEFRADKPLTEQLTQKFRENRQRISALMCREKNEACGPVYAVLEERSTGLQPMISQLKQLQAQGMLVNSLENILFSYIHMLVNRIISAKPRLHELVIYNFLYQYYRSVAFRKINQQYVQEIPTL